MYASLSCCLDVVVVVFVAVVQKLSTSLSHNSNVLCFEQILHGICWNELHLHFSSNIYILLSNLVKGISRFPLTVTYTRFFCHKLLLNTHPKQISICHICYFSFPSKFWVKTVQHSFSICSLAQHRQSESHIRFLCYFCFLLKMGASKIHCF